MVHSLPVSTYLRSHPHPMWSLNPRPGLCPYSCAVYFRGFFVLQGGGGTAMGAAFRKLFDNFFGNKEMRVCSHFLILEFPALIQTVFSSLITALSSQSHISLYGINIKHCMYAERTKLGIFVQLLSILTGNTINFYKQLYTSVDLLLLHLTPQTPVVNTILL